MAGRSFVPFPVLGTERLRLRKLVFSDDQQIFTLRSNEEVNRYLGRKPCRSIDEAKDFINLIEANIQKNYSLYWAITLAGSDSLVGTICLYDFPIDNSSAEIGYELMPDFHGKGIMQEAATTVINYAMQQIGLVFIEAYSHWSNVDSTKLLEKLKFRNEGLVDNNLVKFIFDDRCPP